MGQGISAQKCDGCEKTTPFFGEIYGRMSEDAHGATKSGMGHSIIGDIESDHPKKEFSEFNKFKNELLNLWDCISNQNFSCGFHAEYRKMGKCRANI